MRRISITLAIGLMTSGVVSQTRPQSETPVYWVKHFELPAKCDLAMERLVALRAEAVDCLVGCLTDPRPEIRLRAVRTLGFLGKVAQPALPSIMAMKPGKDSSLALAVASAADAIRGGRGFVLVGDFVTGELVELDGRGKERQVVMDLTDLWSGRRLASGNYLILTADDVREVSSAGKTVWSVDGVEPLDAVRLADGRTLIASAERHRVIEVDKRGKVVWSYTDESREFRPVSCQRLRNGNTLIADYTLTDLAAGRVIEVDKDKRIVWELTWRQPAMVQRLAGDRTLIVSHKPDRVQIVDKAGKVLQQFKDVDIPSVAEYLPNGHLLVGGEGFLRELDAKGVRLWNQRMSWVTCIQRH